MIPIGVVGYMEDRNTEGGSSTQVKETLVEGEDMKKLIGSNWRRREGGFSALAIRHYWMDR